MQSTVPTIAASRIVLTFLLRCMRHLEPISAISIALEESMPPIVELHTGTKIFLAGLRYIGLVKTVSKQHIHISV